MGETVVAAATLAVFLLGMLLGFLAGRPQPVTTRPKPVLRKRAPVKVEEEAEENPRVAGVDIPAERRQIILRAKQEFGMNDEAAARFADRIIRQASPILGRLHVKG